MEEWVAGLLSLKIKVEKILRNCDPIPYMYIGKQKLVIYTQYACTNLTLNPESMGSSHEVSDGLVPVHLDNNLVQIVTLI